MLESKKRHALVLKKFQFRPTQATAPAAPLPQVYADLAPYDSCEFPSPLTKGRHSFVVLETTHTPQQPRQGCLMPQTSLSLGAASCMRGQIGRLTHGGWGSFAETRRAMTARNACLRCKVVVELCRQGGRARCQLSHGVADVGGLAAA